MKLYDVPRGSMIRVLGDIQIPPGAPEINIGDEILFNNLDTMYSNCTRGKTTVYLSAMAEVEIINHEYRCKHVHREGESCTLNNNCTYPNCELVKK